LQMCIRRLWELMRSMKLFAILWHSVIFPFLKLRLWLRGGHVPGDGLAIHLKRRSGSGWSNRLDATSPLSKKILSHSQNFCMSHSEL
jgi:hypothetical protein